MNAREAIEKIESVETTFMGRRVRKYNYAHEIRAQLMAMAEAGKISPAEYWSALQLTWTDMTESLKGAELGDLGEI